jgi:phosphoribosylglycinamide formyltransferase-1
MAANDCIVSAGRSIDWVVVTDRECGIEDWAKKNRFEVHRVSYGNVDQFSQHANEIFDASQCDEILLFFTRRVGAPLIDRKQVWNIHPSILPSFPGLNGVRDAMNGGSRLLGATLHRVDYGLDTGEIVAQVCAPLPSAMPQSAANYISYLQKVWLTLFWIDQLAKPPHPPVSGTCGPGVVLACPGISDASIAGSYANWVQGLTDLDKRIG